MRRTGWGGAGWAEEEEEVEVEGVGGTVDLGGLTDVCSFAPQ